MKKIGFSLSFLFILLFPFITFADQKSKIKMEIWEGCTCSGCIKGYDQLQEKRKDQLIFEINPEITKQDQDLNPIEFAQQFFKKKLISIDLSWYWCGQIYRFDDTKKTYCIIKQTSLKEVKMNEIKEGDLIVFCKESY